MKNKNIKILLMTIIPMLAISCAGFAQPREEDFISGTRSDATAIINALRDLKNKQSEWNALNYGTILSTGTGSNNGITKSQVGAVVFDTTDALIAVLEANGGAHYGNLYKIWGTQAPE